jgi:hypothetical protein
MIAPKKKKFNMTSESNKVKQQQKNRKTDGTLTQSDMRKAQGKNPKNLKAGDKAPAHHVAAQRNRTEMAKRRLGREKQVRANYRSKKANVQAARATANKAKTEASRSVAKAKRNKLDSERGVRAASSVSRYKSKAQNATAKTFKANVADQKAAAAKAKKK